MSDTDPLLGLVDDLLRLELPAGLAAVTIEVEADIFSVSVTRRGAARPDVSLATTERPADRYSSVFIGNEPRLKAVSA